MLRRPSRFEEQAKSREQLRDAVKGYVMLRNADGTYEDTVRTTDRLGRKVVVFVKLEIISDLG